jgi:hypothetical protein
LELTKLAKNGLLNIKIYSNCVVADHVAHSTFYVSNSPKGKKSHIVRSGERWQRPVVSLTHNSARELFSKVLHCWYEKELHLAATTCHRYCEHESLSVQHCNVDSEILSRVEIFFNKVWSQNKPDLVKPTY